jgi:pimeloyl-ACP methyl ester carboxylesterase
LVVNAFAAHHRDRAAVSRLLASGRRLLPELTAGPFEHHRVRCPVLVVWGTRDRMVSHSGAQRLMDGIPHARVELLEDVGHCPQLEATERLADLLLAFPGAEHQKAA